jgi:hypothetical protein
MNCLPPQTATGGAGLWERWLAIETEVFCSLPCTEEEMETQRG